MRPNGHDPIKNGANNDSTADPVTGRDTTAESPVGADKGQAGHAPRSATSAADGQKTCVADGGTHVTPGVAERPTDPLTRGYVHILRALGLTQAQIADIVDLDTDHVNQLLVATRERVNGGEDPIDVYGEVVAPLYECDPDRWDGGRDD